MKIRITIVKRQTDQRFRYFICVSQTSGQISQGNYLGKAEQRGYLSLKLRGRHIPIVDLRVDESDVSHAVVVKDACLLLHRAGSKKPRQHRAPASRLFHRSFDSSETDCHLYPAILSAMNRCLSLAPAHKR